MRKWLDPSDYSTGDIEGSVGFFLGLGGIDALRCRDPLGAALARRAAAIISFQTSRRTPRKGRLSLCVSCLNSGRQSFGSGGPFSLKGGGTSSNEARLLIMPAGCPLRHGAMEAAWNEVADSIPEERREAERTRLAYLVASCAPLALDEEDLKQNVLLLFRQRPASAA